MSTRHAFSFWRFVAVASIIAFLATLAMSAADAAPVGGCPKPAPHHKRQAPSVPLCYCNSASSGFILPTASPADIPYAVAPPEWSYWPDRPTALEPQGEAIGYIGGLEGGFAVSTAAIVTVEAQPTAPAPMPSYPQPRTAPSVRAPELDTNSAGAALMLLFGSLAVINGRIRK